MPFTLHVDFDQIDGVDAVSTKQVSVYPSTVITAPGKNYDAARIALANGQASITLPSPDDDGIKPSAFGFVVARSGGSPSRWNVPAQPNGTTVSLDGFTETTPLPLSPGQYAELAARVDALEAGGGGTGGGGGGPVTWAEVTGKPTTFPPSAHTHDDRYYTEAEVDGLLAGKQSAGTYATPTDVTTASTADRARANHTGTQTSATISDFDSAVTDLAGRVLVVDKGNGTVDLTTSGGGFQLVDNGDGTAALSLDGQTVTLGSSGTTTAALPHLHGVRYVAYGHSFGELQLPPNSWSGGLYPARIRDTIRADSTLYANRTQSGTSMSQIRDRIKSTWVHGTMGLVSILGNQNNHLGNDPGAANYKAALTDALNWLLVGTAPPTILIFKDTTSTVFTDAEVAKYNTALSEVVAALPAGSPVVVADPIADGWNKATMTTSDGLHPNDRGEAHIAASGIKALAGTTYRHGLNYGLGAPPIQRTTIPAITGTATSGSTLTVSNGVWSPVPTAHTYQWLRSGTPIGGATANTYVLTGADVGVPIACTVTVTRSGYGSNFATTAAVTPAS